MRIVVIGGGYGGLAAVIALRHGLPDSEIHVVDPRPHHIKLTHLQRTLYRPLRDYCVSFAALEKRFDFTHHRSALSFSAHDLEKWEWERVVPFGQEQQSFDYLIIATGSQPRKLTSSNGNVYDLDDFCIQEGRGIIENFLQCNAATDYAVSVLGAGATGLQFLFELNDVLKTKGIAYQLRLIDQGERILPALPAGFHDYVYKRLRQASIEYLPHTRYVAQHEHEIELKNTKTDKIFTRPSGLTLSFPGVVPYPWQLQTNRYGQVTLGRTLLPHVFAVGDCSYYASKGLNALTAQAAVRKGKQIAENIKRLQQNRLPYMYLHPELGYFVSLGATDGIGWVGFKSNIVKGLAAFAIKEAIEFQYDLFVDGLDLYV